MLKKIKGLVIAGVITVASLGLVTSASAETTAGWVGIGSDYIDPNGSGNSGVKGGIHYSKGGNIRVEVPNVSFSGTLTMDFFDDDGSGYDDYIGQRKVYSGGGIVHEINVENYVDGDNNRAEIYVVYTWNFGSSPMTIKFLD